MYIIAGLGNPTAQYDHTRHNIGFDTITYLADRYHIPMNTKKFQAICGTGIGISITANRYKGIRAALCTDCFCAEATRQHNDANILAMGGRVVGPGLAIKIVDTFLTTDFEGGRHARRIALISDIENRG